jgi:hypothetical protein
MVKHRVCSYTNNRSFLPEKKKLSTAYPVIPSKIVQSIMSSSKNKDYDVEKIISKRTDSKGRTLYLIKWKGIFRFLVKLFLQIT